MIYKEDIARTTAEFLLQIQAVKLQPSDPFTWTSGIISPIYCDNRITLSFPTIRTYIRQRFVEIAQEEFGDLDLVAGVATGGIAQGALVAQELGLPFVYVRSSQKKHGMENKIEGRIEDGKSVVIIEDLISTGKSSLAAAAALRSAGCIVKGMISIFDYNLEIAQNNFSMDEIKLFSLSDYSSLIQVAIESKYVEKSELDALKVWRENPEAWGK